VPDLFGRAAAFFRSLQATITDALETADGGVPFVEDAWQRAGGGGGYTRVLEEGQVFEKAGVNWSQVEGELPEEIAAHTPGEGRAFRAAGISLVLHPRSPLIPTTHANFRCLAKGGTLWFGGGADLTPCYAVRDDILHFHNTWRVVCDRHDPSFYKQFKRQCDDYFFLKHRGETRGVGGIFFDYLRGDGTPEALERIFAFVQDAGSAFLHSYLPIVQLRREAAWTEAQRAWQLHRRGRYVEFNLIYDRGTIFGLKTEGRTESILMSLPPLVRWGYDHRPEPGSPEAALLDHLRPVDWLGIGS
jgi:coproporphyrinogen III oxidase